MINELRVVLDLMEYQEMHVLLHTVPMEMMVILDYQERKVKKDKKEIQVLKDRKERWLLVILLRTHMESI